MITHLSVTTMSLALIWVEEHFRLILSPHIYRSRVMLGRQTFLNCGMLEGLSHGCNGGDVPDVLEFMAKKGGLPDETCLTYKVWMLIGVGRVGVGPDETCLTYKVWMLIGVGRGNGRSSHFLGDLPLFVNIAQIQEHDL